MRFVVLNSIIVQLNSKYFSLLSKPGLIDSSSTGTSLPSTVTFKDGNSIRFTLGMINSELKVIVTLPSAVMLVMLAVISLGLTDSTQVAVYAITSKGLSMYIKG